MPTLLQYFDADVIPAYLGGKLTDAAGDPECRSLVGPGGPVPATYLVDVGTDNNGAGEEVCIPAGPCLLQSATNTIIARCTVLRKCVEWSAIQILCT
jgi:hypothetical protein